MGEKDFQHYCCLLSFNKLISSFANGKINSQRLFKDVFVPSTTVSKLYKKTFIFSGAVYILTDEIK